MGLFSKLLKLETKIETNRPAAICITESNLGPSIDVVTLGHRDYNIWRRDKTKGNGGGQQYEQGKGK